MAAVDLEAYVARSRAIDLAAFPWAEVPCHPVTPESIRTRRDTLVEAWIDSFASAGRPLAALPPSAAAHAARRTAAERVVRAELEGGRNGDGHH